MTASLTPAIFLDRDDTLIACTSVTPDGDLGDPALVHLLPKVAEAVAQLKSAGFKLIVVSNQGGVARGRYRVSAVDAVNARVNALLGGAIDAFYFCPYHPRGTVAEFAREHPWRKPAPGMILAAAEDHALDLARSWLIGDAPRDCEAGLAAGLRGRTILLTNPDPALGAVGPIKSGHTGDFLEPDLLTASTRVLGAPAPKGKVTNTLPHQAPR